MSNHPYHPPAVKIDEPYTASRAAQQHVLVRLPSLADALAALGINATVYSTDPSTVYPSDVTYTHLWISRLESAEILQILRPIKKSVHIIAAEETIEALCDCYCPFLKRSDNTAEAVVEALDGHLDTALRFLADRVARVPDRDKRAQLLVLIELWQTLDEAEQAVFATDTRDRAGIGYKEWQTIANAHQPEPDTATRKIRWTAVEILNAIFPELEYIVLGLILPGLIILAGRPKSGKSYFGLQLAIAVASGTPFLGRATQKRKVLYCALEDSPRRIQQRMLGQGALKDVKESDLDITYEFEIPPLSGPGVAHIYECIQQEKFGLIIIDTFTRAAGRADQMDQVEMATCMSALHQIALKENVAILIIDHHRKNTGFSGDVVDDILGATSKSGVVDTAIGLYKERGTDQAILKATGRDLDEDAELVLKFSQETLQWSCLGKAEEVITSQVQQEIIDAIKDEFCGEATTAELADHLTKDRGQINRQLKALTESGHLIRCLRKNKQTPYRLNTEPSSPTPEQSSPQTEKS